MKNNKYQLLKRKFGMLTSYLFVSLGGISIVYAAGLSRNSVLEAEIEGLQAEINQNQYKSYYNIASEYEVNKERLENLLEDTREKLAEASPSDAFSLQFQIDSYISQIEELDKKLRDAKLQEKLYEYYENNLELIKKNENEKAAYWDFQNTWKLKVFEAQLNYLRLEKEEAQTRYEITVAKRDLGYALETEVIQDKIIVDGFHIQCDNVEEEIQYIKNELFLGEIMKLELEISEIQSEDYYYKKNLETSITYKYYLNQESAYQVYKNWFQNIASLSNAERIDQEGAELHIKIAQAQKQQFEQNLKQYIHNQISAYWLAKKQFDLKEQEKVLNLKKQKRAEVLYNEGKIQEIELLSFNVEYAKLNYEALIYCSQANDIVYKLKHCIEE